VIPADLEKPVSPCSRKRSPNVPIPKVYGTKRSFTCSMTLLSVDPKLSVWISQTSIWKRGTLLVLGKGRLQKEILTIPSRTKDSLRAWIEARGRLDGPLFINFHHSKEIQGKRLSATSLYRIIRDLGKQTGQKVRPHGLRHTAISEAVRKVQAVGMDVTKVLQFSRHKDLKTLQVYIDQVEDAQGKIAELVSMG
jgi:integrase